MADLDSIGRTLRTKVLSLEEAAFRHVVSETFEMVPEEITAWTEHMSTQIGLLQAARVGKETYRASLLDYRMVELFRNLIWMQHSVVHGAYHSAIRDLRHSLESVVQAIWIDRRTPSGSGGEKLDAVPDVSIGCRVMLRELHVPRAFGIGSLYTDLCKYIHPTRKEMEPVLRDGRLANRVTFSFDEDQFNLVLGLTNRTVDAVAYLFLRERPEARATLLHDEITVETLKSLGQNRTLQALGIRDGQDDRRNNGRDS